MSSERPLPTGVFTNTDDPSLSYKPISAMAVLSLLLGVGSLGAFFAMPMWSLPPIALIIAGLTSRQLEQARGEYGGQFLAKFGLLLAVISIAGAPTIYYTKRFLIARESRSVGDAYLDLILENKIKAAFPLTIRPDMAAAAGDDIDKMIERNGRERYQGFLSQPAITFFGGRGADAQVTHYQVFYLGNDRGVEMIYHVYVVAIYDGDKPKDFFKVSVLLNGLVSADWKGRRWYVEVVNVDPFDPAGEHWKPPAQSGTG